MKMTEIVSEIAHFGDFHCVFDSFRYVGKKRFHLVGGFDIKFASRHTECGIVVGIGCADCHEQFLRRCVFPLRVMHVVGCDDRNVKLTGELYQLAVDFFLSFYAVSLYFNIKIASEYLLHTHGMSTSCIRSVLHERTRDYSGNTCGQCDESFTVTREHFEIGPRTVVKAVYECF